MADGAWIPYVNCINYIFPAFFAPFLEGYSRIHSLECSPSHYCYPQDRERLSQLSSWRIERPSSPFTVILMQVQAHRHPLHLRPGLLRDARWFGVDGNRREASEPKSYNWIIFDRDEPIFESFLKSLWNLVKFNRSILHYLIGSQRHNSFSFSSTE